MFRTIRTFLMLAAAVAPLALAACDDGPAERAGERLDRAVERTGDRIEDATRR